jgi:integrase
VYLDDFSVDCSTMYNLQQKSDFIFAKFSHLESNEIETIIRIFITIGFYENSSKKDLTEFNLKELIDLFESCEWNKANTFAQRKSVMKQYIDWCVIQNKANTLHPIYRIELGDIVGSKKLDRQYFKNLDDLKDCLIEIFDNADVIDNSQFIFAKLVYCLCWLGFTREEVRFLKKQNVNLQNKSIVSELSGYKADNINDYIISLAKECIEAEEYTTKNRYNDRPVKYRNNDYLIRTKTSASVPEDDPVTDNYFFNINARFREIVNDLSPYDKYYTKSITCDSVYYSGLYYKMYEREKENGLQLSKTDYDELSQTSRISKENALGLAFFYDDYHKWLKYFYGI